RRGGTKSHRSDRRPTRRSSDRSSEAEAGSYNRPKSWGDPGSRRGYWDSSRLERRYAEQTAWCSLTVAIVLKRRRASKMKSQKPKLLSFSGRSEEHTSELQ